MKFVSLGCDCLFKTFLTELGYKKKKSEGELTHPFDLTIHDYKSTLYFLKNNFDSYIKDEDIIKNEEGLLINQKWKTVFVHESDNFKDIDYDFGWKEKKIQFDFIENNYQMLKKRYIDRINNFQSLSGKICFCYHTRTNEPADSLFQILKNMHADCCLFVLNTNSNPIHDDYINKNYVYINCPLANNELWNFSQKNSDKVKSFVQNTIEKIIFSTKFKE